MKRKGDVPTLPALAGSGRRRRVSAMAVVGALVCLATFYVLVSPITSPEISIGIALAVVFILPGYLAAKILFPENYLPSLTDVPTAFVASLALWSIPAAVLRLARLDWSWFSVIFLVTLWALGIGYCVRLLRLPETANVPVSSRVLWVEGGVALAGIFAAWIAANAGRSVDDWGYVTVIRQLQTPQGFGMESFLNPRNALRFALQTPVFLEAFALRLSQFDVVKLVRDVLPPLMAPMALLALYAWAKEFSGKAWVGLITVAAQLVWFVVVGADAIGWGFWFFGRAGQDKFMAWLVVMPIGLLFFWRYLQRGGRANLLAYGAALFALVLVHPIGLAVICLAIGGFALFNLMQPSRLPLRRWLLAAGWVLPAAGVAVAFHLVTPENYFMTTTSSDPAVASYLSLSLDRLVFLPPDFYFLHPSLVAHPVMVLAIGLLPLLALRLRHDVRAQFLWGATLVPLALLFTPAGAWALGQLVTPWELWRLPWVLPIGLTLAYFAMLAVDGRAGASTRAMTVTGAWAAVVIAAMVYFAPIDWASTQTLWRRSPEISPQGEEVLRALPRFVSSPSLVLAPLEWQLMINAYELKAYPANTVSMNKSGQQDFDIDRFYESTLYTDRTVRLIALPRLAFVVVPTASYLNEQFLLQPETFARLFQNQEYALYKVVRVPQKTVISTGLRRLEQERWKTARKKLERAAKTTNHPLAFFGLGYAYGELGRMDEAEAALERAVTLAPELRIAHLKLAEVYEQQGRKEDAAREYELAK